MKRPWPAIRYSVIKNDTQRDAGQDEPNAVPEMIRSSIGPSSVGGAMLVGVDAPLGVAERERPKRLKKPIDLEEVEEAVLIGVWGLESTC